MTEQKRTIGGMYLSKYMEAKHIKGHLPVLKEYGKQCEHITEMGVREFNSTWSFLSIKPKKLVSIDWNRPPFEVCPTELDLCKSLSTEAGVDFEFIVSDTLQIEISPTDLLFIDTWHTYEQLCLELFKHSSKVKKYIIAHDTNELVFPGMSWAVYDFIQANPSWEIRMMLMSGPGLTILERRSNQEPASWFDENEFVKEIREQQDLYYKHTDKNGSTNDHWENYRKDQFDKFAKRRLVDK